PQRARFWLAGVEVRGPQRARFWLAGVEVWPIGRRRCTSNRRTSRRQELSCCSSWKPPIVSIDVLSRRRLLLKLATWYVHQSSSRNSLLVANPAQQATRAVADMKAMAWAGLIPRAITPAARLPMGGSPRKAVE